MNIAMMIIFMLTDFSIIGIFSFVYAGKECYKNGMVLGVHLPQSEVQDSDVCILTQNYKKRLKTYHLINLGISTVICLLWFFNSTAFMILWMIWLLAYTLLGMLIVNLAQRSMYQLKVQKRWIIEVGESPEDKDENWKKGWYSNPDDKRFWVRDRMNTINYSMNMAKTSAKIVMGATFGITAVSMVAISVLMIRLDNTQIKLLVSENQVSIGAAMYDISFQKEEIQGLEVVEKLPEEEFDRTNGGATEKLLIGHFEGEQTGKCMLYLYREYTPVLKIELKDQTIFINSKEENQVQEWYQQLAE